MFKEFKEFILRGNVIDLAIGVIIGAAFGKIVSSLVADILTPLLGLVLGKVDFSNLFIVLGGGNYPTLADAKRAGVPTVNYGLFINNVLDFLIVAFCIFITMKQINKLVKKREAAITKGCPFCKSEINLEASRCPHCTSQIA